MDELTLRRAQRGDPQAFEMLITPHEQMVWRVCWHYLHHTEDARDCAQEVMLKAWRSIAAFRQDCSLESWLYRICTSVCVDFLRRRRHAAQSIEELHEEGYDPPDAAPLPDEEIAQRQSRDTLRRAIDQLPEDMRTVLILYALEKKRYEEIAQITGAAVGTVKSRLNRARQRLSEILTQWEQSGISSVQHREGRKNR